MQQVGIHWLNQHDMGSALQRSCDIGKPVLMDFHDPTCDACITLDRDTYSDPSVIVMITEHAIPLRVVTVEPDRDTAEIINCYISISTPTVQLLTGDGTVCHYWRGSPCQTVLSARQIAQSPRRVYLEARGHLPPALFCAQLLIGRGKAALKYGRFDDALRLFEEVLAKYSNDEEVIAETRYWKSRVASKTSCTLSVAY
jgi:Thioredoxin-like